MVMLGVETYRTDVLCRREMKLMDGPITRAEHEEFRRLMDEANKRLDDENQRQNRRIQLLEDNVQETRQLAASVKELAISMASMAKEQERQGKRLETIEGRDGEKWRTVVSHIATTIVGAVIMYFLGKNGM